MSKFDIASAMNNLIQSPQYQSVFAKPSFTKTAAKKDEKAKEKEDKKKKEEKAKAKKDDKNDAKCKAKKVMNKYQACVIGLAKISEALDEAGFDKASTYALFALDSLVKQAVPTGDLSTSDCGLAKDKKEDKEDKKEKEEEKEEKDEEKEEKEEEEKEEKEDEDDANDIANAFSGEKGDPFAPGGILYQPTAETPSTLTGAEGDPFNDIPLDEGKADDMADAVPWKEDPELLDLYEQIKDQEPDLTGKEIELNPKHEFSAPEDEDEFSFLSALHPGDENKEDKEDKKDEEGGDDEDITMESLLGRTQVANEKRTSFNKLADELDTLFVTAKKGEGKVKARNRPSPVFDAKNPKVKDNKDHFPLGNENQARNALARASQYSSSPPWYSGSLSELVNAVRRAVKSKYPEIKTSEKSKNPGKG